MVFGAENGNRADGGRWGLTDLVQLQCSARTHLKLQSPLSEGKAQHGLSFLSRSWLKVVH